MEMISQSQTHCGGNKEEGMLQDQGLVFNEV